MKLLVIKGKQGNQDILTGFLTAPQLLSFTKIDRWKPGADINEQGCQREPIAAHYKKIARKLKDDVNAILPTSLTLTLNIESTRFRLEPTNIDNVYIIDIEYGDILITDGQHRKLAVGHALTYLKLDELAYDRINKMQFPFCLILTKDRVDQIKMFYEINSTSKKVPTDLALQLLNEINRNQNMKKTYAEKAKLVAINICNILDKRENSVWKNSINLVGKDSSKIASITSFVTSLKPILNIKFIKKIIKETPKEDDAALKIADLIDSYWSALAGIMPKAFPIDNDLKSKWCIQKTPGLYSLHLVAAFIIEKCLFEGEKIRRFSVTNIQNFIIKYGNYSFKGYENFWLANDKANEVKGGEASRANSNKEFNLLAQDIIDDISENYFYNDDEEIEFK